uniref:P-type domain-containing protein n=1 Tax=Takifugu rubripes TaxID=31033 RepID=A0A3B5KIR5_TAKRU
MLRVIGSLLLFTLTFLPYLYFHQFYNDTMVFLPGRAKQDTTSTHNDTIKYNNSVKLQRAMHRGRSRVNDFSRDPECTMAPDSRFDCARDKAVSQSECEQRGCCYAPGSDSAGPPWCFYPGLYRGYRMGPLVPTLHGLTATLTRAAPSYLPRDISVLQLDFTEEATDWNRLFLLQMKDPSSPRYEVELPAVVVREETDAEDLLYTTEYQPDPFGFIVRRKTNGRVM